MFIMSHIFNKNEYNNLSNILSKYDTSNNNQRQPQQQPQQMPNRNNPQQQHVQQRSPPPQAQLQQRDTGKPQMMQQQVPRQGPPPKVEEGPRPLDSFDNMSGGFGGGFSGIEINQMGFGCKGEKLPPSKVSYTE